MKAKTSVRAGISCTPNPLTTGAYSGGCNGGLIPAATGDSGGPLN